MTKSEESSDKLNNQPIDYITSAVKGTLGAIPFAGSLLAELAGTIIPNQRLDRVTRFAEALEAKLSTLDQEFIRSQLTNENFSDLLEEGARQAARSLSNERREYIANLVANSLSQHDIEYVESKHLLRLLGELNDIEIIWLRFHLEPNAHLRRDGDEEFREKHKNVLSLAIDLDKEALQQSYKAHLTQVGLLNISSNQPTSSVIVSDKNVERPGHHHYQITSLGVLLLKQIGLFSPEQV